MNIKSPFTWILAAVPVSLMIVGALIVCGVVDPCDPKYKRVFDDIMARGRRLAKDAQDDVKNRYDDIRSDIIG